MYLIYGLLCHAIFNKPSLSNVHCHISARETESDRERVRGNDREN